MLIRVFKLRFRRLFRLRQKQAEDLSVQAERTFERHVVKPFSKLRHIKRFVITWVSLVLLLIVGVLLQNFQLTKYYQTLRPIPGGTYREGVLGTFSTANPLYASNTVDSSVSRLIFASLFRYDQNNKLVGDLASSYEIDAKGTVYTVHLKPNLTWHDGKPLTSADVMFTYQLIQNPDARSPLLGSWQGIVVSAPDAKTVVFTLPGPLASFPYNITNGIVPRHKLASVPAADLRTADFNTVNPIGSGPFEWRAIQVSGSEPSTAEEQIALSPFSGYRGGAPKLDQFIVHAYADQEQMIQEFEDGELTGLAGLSSVPPELRKLSKLEIHNLMLTAGTYSFFKNSHPILGDQKVRQALVQAADPSAIINKLGYPTRAVRGPFLNGMLAHDANLDQPKHDLVAAKSMLDQAGWIAGKNGIRHKDGQPLSFTMVVPDTPEYRLVLDELSSQWEKAGVKLRVRILNGQDFQNALSSHDYDAVLYGISIGVDPDVFGYWDSSQFDVRSINRLNLSEYKNATADAALESGRTRLNSELRIVKYKPFLQAWRKDLPALGLYQPRVLYLTNGNVDGLTDTSINSSTDRFSNVADWQIRQAGVTN